MVCFWAGPEFAPQGAWAVDTWKDDTWKDNTWKEDTCTNLVMDRTPGKFFSFGFTVSELLFFAVVGSLGRQRNSFCQEDNSL